MSLEVYCSRSDTVKELISKLCQSDEASDIGHKTCDEMIQYCRLWKMEGDETFQDIQECLQSGRDMPFEVAGTVLSPHLLI